MSFDVFIPLLLFLTKHPSTPIAPTSCRRQKMRPWYIPINVRLVLIAWLLTLSCVGILGGAVWVLSRDALLGLEASNLDVQSSMKETQVYTLLNSMLSQLLRVTTSSQVQQIMKAPDDEQVFAAYNDTLTSSLDNSSLVALTIYFQNTTEFTSFVLNTMANVSIPSSLMPLDSDIIYQKDIAASTLNQTGIYVAGPDRAENTPSYFFSLTVPVIVSKIWSQPTKPSQLVNGNLLGYATAIFTSVKVEQALNETNASMLSSGICAAAMAELSESGTSVTYVLPVAACDGANRQSSLLPNSISQQLANQEETHAVVNGGLNKSMVSVVAMTFFNKNYVVLLQQSHAGTFRMVHNLRNIIVITMCSVFAGMAIVALVLGQFGTRQIVKLKEATTHQKQPSTWHQLGRTFKSPFKHYKGPRGPPGPGGGEKSTIGHIDSYNQDEEALITDASAPCTSESQVPEKVPLRKHIRDELDLITERFNEMGDELREQYRVLEERVEARKSEIQFAQQVANDANNAKSHFLARVTHELRTPLNGILGTASLCLEEDLTEDNLSNVHGSLKTIFKCGELLLHLLTELLSFSQNEVENLDLDEHEFMIAEATAQLTAVFREQSEASGIQLEIHADPSCQNLILYGDINRILQIVFNLMSNSLKFTPSGGKVSFFVRADKIADTPNQRLVTIVVRDTGPGIAPHLQKRVFEAFVQGDINNTARKAGVGLGLSICRQLAERMGGSISLKSELNHGAEFTFRVPLRYVPSREGVTTPGSSRSSDVWPEYELYSSETIVRKAEMALDHTSAKKGSPGGSQPTTPLTFSPAERPTMKRGTSFESTVSKSLRVLVVDDNKVNQEVMVRMLNLEGLKNIDIANDGNEAIEQTKEALESQEPYDVIFMDIQMPNLDGRQATKILRGEMDVKIPIVAVSAFTGDENVQQCLAVGMSLFLAKPLRRPHLHKLLLTLNDLAVMPPLPEESVGGDILGHPSSASLSKTTSSADHNRKALLRRSKSFLG